MVSPQSTPERTNVPVDVGPPGTQTEEQVARATVHQPTSNTPSSPTRPVNPPPDIPAQKTQLSESGFSSIAPSVSASAAAESPPLEHSTSTSFKAQVTSTQRTSLITAAAAAGASIGADARARGTGSSAATPTSESSAALATGRSSFGEAIATADANTQLQTTSTTQEQAVAAAAAAAEAFVEAQVDALFGGDADGPGDTGAFAVAPPVSHAPVQSPVTVPKAAAAADATASSPFERTSSARNSRLLGRQKTSNASVRLNSNADPSTAAHTMPRSGSTRLSLRVNPATQSTASPFTARSDPPQAIAQTPSQLLQPAAVRQAGEIEFTDSELRGRSPKGELSAASARGTSEQNMDSLREVESSASLLSQSGTSKMQPRGDREGAMSFPNGDLQRPNDVLGDDRSLQSSNSPPFSLDMAHYPRDCLYMVCAFLIYFLFTRDPRVLEL